MAVTLHRCPVTFLKTSWHGCYQVQKALEEEGIEHEVVKVPLRKSKRDEVNRLTGQTTVPVIAFEDGTGYRAESKEIVEKIRSGQLFEGRA